MHNFRFCIPGSSLESWKLKASTPLLAPTVQAWSTPKSRTEWPPGSGEFSPPPECLVRTSQIISFNSTFANCCFIIPSSSWQRLSDGCPVHKLPRYWDHAQGEIQWRFLHGLPPVQLDHELAGARGCAWQVLGLHSRTDVGGMKLLLLPVFNAQIDMVRNRLCEWTFYKFEIIGFLFLKKSKFNTYALHSMNWPSIISPFLSNCRNNWPLKFVLRCFLAYSRPTFYPHFFNNFSTAVVFKKTVMK